MGFNRYTSTPCFIRSSALPVLVVRELESQQAEEGGNVTLHCELSKPGLAVEWKKGTQVLSFGEKYQMRQTGFSHELHICDLTPGDTGNYSCCSEDTISSACLSVNGRMETTSSPHTSVLKSFISFVGSFFSISSQFLNLHCRYKSEPFFLSISCPSRIHKRAGQPNS